MLHVVNGDATRVRLEPSGVPGDMTVWADVLHDGPVPDLPPGAFRAVRAAHLSGVVGESEGVIARNLEQRDMALERYRDHEEVVFWFEHDLFDQLILARHLHWLSTIDRASVRFSLICVGEYPGIAPFNGLGQLSPTQLATLFPGRVPISDTQISTGRRAWNLFRAPDPVPLSAWHTSADTSALPFLEGALRRHLEDCPWLGDGLSRSERQILRTLGDRPYTAGDLFAATQALEERVFMGDATFWSIVRGLARGPHPLVTIAPHGRGMPTHEDLVELTNAGRDVLAGAVDHVALNGIDRWMGGAHLTTEHHWRWGGVNVAFGAPGGTDNMAPEDDDRDRSRRPDDADTGGGDEDAGMEEEVGGGWVVVGGSGDTGAPGSQKPAARKTARQVRQAAPRTSKPAPKRSSAKAPKRTPKAPKRAAAKKATKRPNRSAAKKTNKKSVARGSKKSAAPKRTGARKVGPSKKSSARGSRTR